MIIDHFINSVPILRIPEEYVHKFFPYLDSLFQLINTLFFTSACTSYEVVLCLANFFLHQLYNVFFTKESVPTNRYATLDNHQILFVNTFPECYLVRLF